MWNGDAVSEAQVVAQLASGDTHALEHLHQRYHAELWRFAYGIVKSRDVAEDLTQDAFVALWMRRTSLDPSRSVRAYLYGIVRNGALMALRSARIAEQAEQKVDADIDAPLIDADDALDARELQHSLTRALAQLTERQRTAVTLRWLRQMPYDDVAAVMGISRQAVDALLQRTYGTLRAALAPFRHNRD